MSNLWTAPNITDLSNAIVISKYNDNNSISQQITLPLLFMITWITLIGSTIILCVWFGFKKWGYKRKQRSVMDINNVSMVEMYRQTSKDEQNLAAQIHLESNNSNDSKKSETTHVYKRGPFCNTSLAVLIAFLTYIIVLIFVFLLYGIGQVTSLKIENFFCDSKTMDEIHEHSRMFNATEGIDEGCWKSKGNSIDEKLLFSVNAYTTEYNGTTWNIIKAVTFIAMTVYSIIVWCYWTFNTVLEIIKYYRNDYYLFRKKLTPNKQASTSNQKDNLCCKCIKKCCDLRRTGLKRCGWDTLPSILLKFSVELFEILVQMYILFVYNGYNIFDRGNVYLANSENYIISFCVLITLNGIATSILWLLYVLRNDLCHGQSFYNLIWICDVFFETGYVLFPVAFYISGEFSINEDTILKTSAVLSKDNSLLFIQVLVPSILLCIKMYTNPKRLIEKTHEGWRNETITTQTNMAIDYDAYINNESSIALLCNKNKLKFISPEKSKVTQGDSKHKRYVRQQRRRKLCLFLMILSLFGMSIGLLLSMLNYFNKTMELCDMYKYNDDISNHNEMRIWNNCQFKVYPFIRYNNEIPCQCRILTIDSNQFSSILSEYDQSTTRKIVIDVLEHFYMMETIQIHSQNLKIQAINLTTNMFNSEYMRVFDMKGIGFNAIENGISNWKSIQYLSINNPLLLNVPLYPLNNELKQLKNARYIFLEYMDVGNMEFICEMKELTDLILIHPQIISLPNCLINRELDKLQIIKIDYANSANNVLFTSNTTDFFKGIQNLFGLPELKEISFYRSSLSIFDFDDQPFSYHYNNATQYILDGTTYFCGYFYIATHMLYIYSKHIYHFIINTHACDNFFIKYNENNIHFSRDVNKNRTFLSVRFLPDQWKDVYNDEYNSMYKYDHVWSRNELNQFVESTTDIKLFLCTPDKYANGICNDECNNDRIGYDGGDCMQLCNFDICNATIFDHAPGNKYQCHQECNNPECLYDNFQCIGLNSTEVCAIESGVTQCAIAFRSDFDKGLTLQKRTPFVNDELCQDPCNIEACNYDNGRCSVCDGTSYCGEYNTYFSIFAALNTNDNNDPTNTLLDVSELEIGLPLYLQVTQGVKNPFTNVTIPDIFYSFDLDNNGYLNAYETLMVMLSGYVEEYSPIATIGFRTVARYVNCSFCFQDIPTYYYPWNYNEIKYYADNAHIIVHNKSAAILGID